MRVILPTAKNKLITAPILAYPDFNKEFFVTSDASDQAIGAVLSQGGPKNDHPICYASRALNDAEKRYSTIEKELLAIVYAVEQFRPYIYGRRFTIITDHKPLVWLMNLKDHSSRLMRWRIRLEEYDYKIVHKSGKLNANADALSRAIPDIEDSPKMQTISVNVLTRNQAKIQKGKEDLPLNNQISSDQGKTQAQQIPIIETSLSLVTTKNLNNKIFILPMTDSELERILDSKLQFKSQNIDLVNKATTFSIKGKTLILSKINIPFRTNQDKINLEHILTEIKKVIPVKSLNELNISFPQQDLQTNSIIKEALMRIFREQNIVIKIYQGSVRHLIKQEEINQVLKDYHLLPTGGHQGTSRTIKRIRKQFYWNGMSKDISEYVKKCTLCQTNKSSKIPKIPMKITDISSKPFERVYLDVVGPLPITHSKKKYILTFQDDLSKFSEATPVENVESRTLAEAFVTNIVCRHGIPESILTDQAPIL